MVENGPFWQSRKFWMQIMAVILFAVLAVTKTVEFSSEQVLVFVLGLAGLGMGAHAATDIASLIVSTRREKPGIPGLGQSAGRSALPGDTIGERGER
jgi:hypothetical protein